MIPNNERNFFVMADSCDRVHFWFTLPAHSPLHCFRDGIQTVPVVGVAAAVAAAVGVAAAGTPAACTADSAGPVAAELALLAVKYQ